MNIGQSNPKKMRWCPNLDEHRTKQSQKDEAVSEAERTSDKAVPKR